MATTTVQTAYASRHAIATAGLIADTSPNKTVQSFVAEGAVPFGYGAFRGTAAESQAKVSGTGPTSGSVTDTTTYPVADQDTNTEVFIVDGGPAQTLTFSGATTTAAAVIAAVNAQIQGVIASDDGGQVKVISLSTGVGSGVAIGTGTTALTWDTPVGGANSTFIGVAVKDYATLGGPSGQYNDEAVLGLMTEGPIWINLETTGSIGDALTIDATTGRIGNNAVGGNYVAINAILETAAASTGDLVRIRLQTNG